MSLYLKCCAAVWIIAMAVVQEPAGNSRETADAKELSRLETVWNEAHMRGDADALDRLWADDLIVTVTNMSVMTKSDALGFSRSGRMKFERYETSEIRVRVYGDAAVVTGRLLRTRSMNGRSLEDNWRFTKTYVRQAGRWQVVAYHSSNATQ